MNMKTIKYSMMVAMLLTGVAMSASDKSIPNRLIDYAGFVGDVSKVGMQREQRRLTEDQFIQAASQPGTILFDARSNEKFRLLHLKGAAHLSLPDVTEAELQKVIPDKSTRVLIYCNNNFENEPVAFPSKTGRASLNIYTFNTLYSYGYTNVYELGPLIDIHKTKLEFEGTNTQGLKGR
jgi:rhodanese-related sulfurtransferase